MIKHADDDHYYRGFSLIEMAIVTVIVGFILASMLESFTLYRKNEVVRSTQDNLDTVSSSIMLFFSENGRYPIPAGRTLTSTDANFGLETVIGDLPAINTCNAENVCRVDGARDVKSDGIDDPVLIGAVPFKSLSPPIENAQTKINDQIAITTTYDGWDYQMTYAVTETLTDDLTFAPDDGAVAVRTENGDSLVSPDGSAHMVLLSHGNNGAGAYTPSGSRIACAGAGVDLENCNDDSLFISGLIAQAPGANYFDDVVLFNIWKTTSLWTQSATDPDDIYNRNAGRVGIGTDNPQHKLHVAGHVEALKIQTPAVCDQTGADCFDPVILGGSGISCPNPDEVVIAIRNNDVVCSGVVAPPVAIANCPGGEIVSGVAADGSLICDSP